MQQTEPEEQQGIQAWLYSNSSTLAPDARHPDNKPARLAVAPRGRDHSTNASAPPSWNPGEQNKKKFLKACFSIDFAELNMVALVVESGKKGPKHLRLRVTALGGRIRTSSTLVRSRAGTSSLVGH